LFIEAKDKKMKTVINYIIKIIIITVILTSVNLYADQKVVAVLPFSNTSGEKHYDYLNESIPEAIITSVAELKRFKIVERHAVKGLLEDRKLEVAGLTDTAAQEVSKLLKADIYILGSFMALENEIRINARIFDVHNGEVLGAANVQGGVDSKIFDLLDELADKMADSLDKAVPYEKIVTVTVFGKGYGGENFSVFSGPFMYIPHLNIGDSFAGAIGFSFEFGRGDILLKGLFGGVQLGFASMSSSDKYVDSLSIIPITGVAGYEYHFPWYAPLVLRHYLAAGGDIGVYQGHTGSKDYRVPQFGVGTKFIHFIWSGFSAAIDFKYTFQIDESINSYYFLGLGVLYQI
jgi:TolB-like protein